MSNKIQSELFYTRKKALRQNLLNITFHKSAESEIVTGKFSGIYTTGKRLRVSEALMFLNQIAGDFITCRPHKGYPYFRSNNEMEPGCLFPCREAHHISALAATKLSSQAQQNFYLV